MDGPVKKTRLTNRRPDRRLSTCGALGTSLPHCCTVEGAPHPPHAPALPFRLSQRDNDCCTAFASQPHAGGISGCLTLYNLMPVYHQSLVAVVSLSTAHRGHIKQAIKLSLGGDLLHWHLHLPCLIIVLLILMGWNTLMSLLGCLHEREGEEEEEGGGGGGMGRLWECRSAAVPSRAWECNTFSCLLSNPSSACHLSCSLLWSAQFLCLPVLSN